AAMHHADPDVRLADLDVPHLLIDQLLRDRLLRVGLKLAERNVVARAHVARGLRIGGVDLGLRHEADHATRDASESEKNLFHDQLSPPVMWARTQILYSL